MLNHPDKSPRRPTIQSIDRAARILKLLASGPRRLGVSEIADRLELTRPTVHGMLQTLQAHGFVEQDRDSDKYQLGAGLLQLGNSYLDLNELVSGLDDLLQCALGDMIGLQLVLGISAGAAQADPGTGSCTRQSSERDASGFVTD